MDCSPPGSSVHGVLQAGILEGAAIHCLVTNYSSSAIILLLSSGFCGPGIRERSSGSISGSRCRDCTRTRACVKHPLWTLAKPRLRLTWAGVSESWPGLFWRGKGQVPPPTLVRSGIRGSPVCVWFTVCAHRPSLSAERPRVKPAGRPRVKPG